MAVALEKEPEMLKKRFAKRAAFTLVEIMVVTTIMTSQANNYGNVKKIAYQKVCANNLRQLYMALTMYDMNNGGLPNAKFFPKKPKQDPKSLVKILGPSYAPTLVCPVFPSAIKNKGLTYLYNDDLAGESLASISQPRKTWLLMEMNAVSDKVPMPHPGGFHILWADGRVEVTKKIPARFAEIQKKLKERDKNKPEKGK